MYTVHHLKCTLLRMYSLYTYWIILEINSYCKFTSLHTLFHWYIRKKTYLLSIRNENARVTQSEISAEWSRNFGILFGVGILSHCNQNFETWSRSSKPWNRNLEPWSWNWKPCVVGIHIYDSVTQPYLPKKKTVVHHAQIHESWDVPCGSATPENLESPHEAIADYSKTRPDFLSPI